MYKEAWKAKNEDGLRLTMPDKVTHTKIFSWEDLISLATRYYVEKKDYKVERNSNGISISWTDWPKQELSLRKERCPYCFLDWGQQYSYQHKTGRDVRGHIFGCPNGGFKPYE